MDLLKRFAEYAQAFELTYADDDWQRLEPFFAPDAVYRVVGSGLWDCLVKGRGPALTAMHKFIDEFDRHCARAISAIRAPVVGPDSVYIAGRASYRRRESDELVFDIAILAEYRDDGALVALTDIHAEENARRVRAWIERWGQGLNPSYV